MKEIWKPIPGYKNYYASNLGNIRNNKSDINKALKKKKDGYYHVNIRNDLKQMKTVSVHRLVALAFLNNNIENLQIDHVDNDKTNNTLTNLRVVSPKLNMNNTITKHTCRIANKDRIRMRYTDVYGNDMIFESAHEAAELFGVSRNTIIRLLRTGKSRVLSGQLKAI